ncbi:MAG: C45 family peptidase [Chlamydiota bacterium]
MTTLPLFAEIIDREGDCYLETIQGQHVLHLKGSYYEMGYAHGKLLQKEIQANVTNYIDKKREGFEEQTTGFQNHLMTMLSHTPNPFIEEIRGMAAGSNIPFIKLLILNLFPEMFHCSGLVAFNDATKNGEFYHVRVLDYSIGKNLQETAVLIVAEPERKIPFVNVSYAGFIGSITGMNLEQISVGEIGGKGYGSWEGMPMAFLMRELLENADSLEIAKQIFSETKRTCEYYYVVSDGKTQDAFGAYATKEVLQFIEPSTLYTIHSIEHPEGKSFDQPKDCVALSGVDRYPVLRERIMEHYGAIDELVLQEIIKRPVSMESNLHNVIFLPKELKLLVAHAGKNGEPACDEPYTLFSLEELLKSPASVVDEPPVAQALEHAR